MTQIQEDCIRPGLEGATDMLRLLQFLSGTLPEDKDKTPDQVLIRFKARSHPSIKSEGG